MIGFDHQHIAAAQLITHARRHVAEIGSNPNFCAFCAKGESHWISRVMWNSEWRDRNIADLK